WKPRFAPRTPPSPLNIPPAGSPAQPYPVTAGNSRAAPGRVAGARPQRAALAAGPGSVVAEQRRRLPLVDGPPAGVRQALAALGKDASLSRLQGHLKDRLGVEMTTNHISDARGKILKKEAGQGKAAQKPPAKKEGAREAPAEPQARKPATKRTAAQK